MTVQEKAEKIKQAQEEFVQAVEAHLSDYRVKVRQLMKGMDERKIAAIRKELGI
jgi:DNA-directed RNA polymerase specialized sigma24 family protein